MILYPPTSKNAIIDKREALLGDEDIGNDSTAATLGTLII
jgi:hypothetical protein